MWLLREKLSDFGVKQILHRVDIALYVHPKNSLRSHLIAIMVLDHSRYTPASRAYIFGVENKSDRIFCIRKVYFTNSCQEIWVHANQPFVSFLYTTSEEKEYYEALFLSYRPLQNAVFHNFSRQIAFIQYSGPSKHAWTFN